ncbi:MAG: prolipoprotein diacylglyceryl transferase [Burkholderiaceae bacterium]|jgi:phosphatidylglycerol:prolipoprotein diacylglycerol transferase|nr:prolipoprotein diacylglyceryl transferase [Burkholderiaceae bacterium]
MLIQPQIDPIAIQLGPLAVHWYGITYLVAFALFYVLATLRLRHEPFASVTQPAPWRRADIEDMLFWGVFGVIVGGRLGYCLFYKPGYYAVHPLEVFYIWQGGMSFHGGMLGVIVTAMAWARVRGRPWLQVADLVAPCMPLGLGSGRIGNFINGELWGRVADPSLPWAMVFRDAGDAPRHPSQIYQFLLEGVVLFVLLWLYARRPRRMGQVSGAFFVGYGAQRFIAEYFREPDAFLGLRALGLSQGQWLSIPMIVAGIGLWWWASRRSAPEAGPRRG